MRSQEDFSLHLVLASDTVVTGLSTIDGGLKGGHMGGHKLTARFVVKKVTQGDGS